MNSTKYFFKKLTCFNLRHRLTISDSKSRSFSVFFIIFLYIISFSGNFKIDTEAKDSIVY